MSSGGNSNCRSSASRLHYDRENPQVSYSCTSAYDKREHVERLSPHEFIARLASHIPDPNERLVRYSGHYSNRSRGARRSRTSAVEMGSREERPITTHRRSQWQQLLRRVFHLTFTCPTCHTDMKIIALITEHEPIHKILAHLKSNKIDPRAGPFAHKAA